MELNLEKFNPQKAELQTLADKYKDLEIQGIDDKTGYKIVDEARKELKNMRVKIEKTGKEMRDEANKFAKSVIEYEKGLVALIEPVEIELKKKQEIIDIQKEREARKTLLPERKEKLKEYWVEIADEELLDMDSTNFQDFFNQKRAEYLEEKERKLKEDQEKLDAEKKAKELEEQRQKELKETEERARIETEARLKREQEEKERKAKEEEEAKIQAEKAEQEKLEKETKYKKFLSSHEWQFDKIIKEDWKVILYKKVAEFII